MEKENEIVHGAIKNLSGTDLKDHSFDHDELKFLSNWTYIGMFLHEAERSLSLSQQFDSKGESKEMDELILSHGMFKNAILSYSKCFSSASNGKVYLDGSVVFRQEEELKGIHNKMMNIRNTFIAHNGTNDVDIALIAVKENDGYIELAQTYTLRTPFSEFSGFLKVISFVQAWVIEIFNKKVDKIQSRIGKMITFK